MFLLIANMGDPAQADATEIQQKLAQRLIAAIDYEDNNVFGITGLPFGSDTIVSELEESTCVPTISVAPMNNTNRIACFRSVAPTLQDQADAGASYIKDTLHLQNVAIIYATGDKYSEALRDAFQSAFGSQSLPPQSYAEGNSDDIKRVADDMLVDKPDLIYFTGPAEDIGTFLDAIGHAIPVMGTDRSYQFVHVKLEDKQKFNGLLFTSFAYPDQWSIQTKKPETLLPFDGDYQDAYDQDLTHSGNPYNYSRANNESILAYDALSLLADACKRVLAMPNSTLSQKTLWNELLQYTPTPGHEFEGVSGQISYGQSDSVPSEKAVLMLKIEDTKIKPLNLNTDGKGKVQGGRYCQLPPDKPSNTLPACYWSPNVQS